jgi:hypothetical protein
MRLGILILSLSLASPATCSSAEVFSQQLELITSAQVSPGSGGPSSLDQDSRQNQGPGDRALTSTSQASLDGIAVHTEAHLILRRTNTAASTVFWMENEFDMHSEGQLLTTNTSYFPRASASSAITFQFGSETPFHYSITTSGQPFPALPASGGFSLRTANGNAIVDMTWFSGTDNQSQSEGNLPPGFYQVRYFNSATTDGSITPNFINHIGGAAHNSVAFTVTPTGSIPDSTATLQLRRGPANSVVLEMTNLQPGTHYSIERAEGLNQFWQAITSFTAAGTAATWTEPQNQNSQTVFYRLRF